MNLERLKALLEAGSITQEEFDSMAKNFEDEQMPEDQEQEKQKDDEFDRMFQSKFDRAMAKERKEKAELKKQLEKLQRKMLTDEEAKSMEFEEQQKEIEEQRRELAIEKNKMYAVKTMKKAGIGDSEETLSIVERLAVTCEDESDIDDVIALLKTWHDQSVKAEVSKRFRDGGYTPKKSDNLNGGVNPYTKEQFNLTTQMMLENTNPELAAQLKAAAGVK